MKITSILKGAVLSSALLLGGTMLAESADAKGLQNFGATQSVKFSEKNSNFGELARYKNQYVVFGGKGLTEMQRYKSVVNGTPTGELSTLYLSPYQSVGYLVKDVVKGKSDVYMQLENVLTKEVFYADVNSGQLEVLKVGNYNDNRTHAMVRTLNSTFTRLDIRLNADVTTYTTASDSKYYDAKFTKSSVVLPKGSTVNIMDIFTDAYGKTMAQGYILGKTVYFPLTSMILDELSKTVNFSTVYGDLGADMITYYKQNPNQFFFLENSRNVETVTLKENVIYEYKLVGDKVTVTNVSNKGENYTFDLEVFAKYVTANYIGSYSYVKKSYDVIFTMLEDNAKIIMSDKVSVKFKTTKTITSADGKRKQTFKQNAGNVFSKDRIQLSYLDGSFYYIVNIAGTLYKINESDVTVSYLK